MFFSNSNFKRSLRSNVYNQNPYDCNRNLRNSDLKFTVEKS